MPDPIEINGNEDIENYFEFPAFLETHSGEKVEDFQFVLCYTLFPEDSDEYYLYSKND